MLKHSLQHLAEYNLFTLRSGRLQRAAGGGRAAARAPLQTKCTLMPKQVPENVTHGAGGGMRLGSSRLSAKRSTRGCASASMAACEATHTALAHAGGQPSKLHTCRHNACIESVHKVASAPEASGRPASTTTVRMGLPITCAPTMSPVWLSRSVTASQPQCGRRASLASLDVCELKSSSASRRCRRARVGGQPSHVNLGSTALASSAQAASCNPRAGGRASR